MLDIGSASWIHGLKIVAVAIVAQAVLPTGWISKADFLTGYDAAQAVPGPLFTFAGYLGAMIRSYRCFYRDSGYFSACLSFDRRSAALLELLAEKLESLRSTNRD